MNHRTNDCEITVLGTGLGGLIAATRLARGRHRVLLLKEKGYESSCRREGYRFIPYSSFSERRLRPSLLRRISKELDLPFPERGQERIVPVKMDPVRTKGKVPFQVILPDARVDLFDDLAHLKAEWRREFPGEAGEIEALYERWARGQDSLKAGEKKEGFPFFPLKRRSLIRKWLPFLSEETKGERLSSLSQRFNEFVQLQLVPWGNFVSDFFPISLAAYLVLHEERGEWIAGLDLGGLEERIMDHFLKSGGEVEEIEKAERVNKRWREGFILTLERDRRVFQSKFLILNVPLHTSAGLLGEGRNPCSKWQQRIRPRYVLFPCFLGIRERVVPIGMRDLLVSMQAMGKPYPYEEGNVLLVSLSPRGDEESAPEGRRALTVESLIPIESLQDWNQAAFNLHQQKVVNHLSNLFPFLEEFLEFTDFDWASEQMRRWSYPHFLYETEKGFGWREGVVPVQVSRRLYFTGKESFPYLGVEGEVLSGLMVAEQILKKVS